MSEHFFQTYVNSQFLVAHEKSSAELQLTAYTEAHARLKAMAESEVEILDDLIETHRRTIDLLRGAEREFVAIVGEELRYRRSVNKNFVFVKTVVRVLDFVPWFWGDMWSGSHYDDENLARIPKLYACVLAFTKDLEAKVEGLTFMSEFFSRSFPYLEKHRALLDKLEEREALIADFRHGWMEDRSQFDDLIVLPNETNSFQGITV